jgi:hypothetical protein
MFFLLNLLGPQKDQLFYGQRMNEILFHQNRHRRKVSFHFDLSSKIKSLDPSDYLLIYTIRRHIQQINDCILICQNSLLFDQD